MIVSGTFPNTVSYFTVCKETFQNDVVAIFMTTPSLNFHVALIDIVVVHADNVFAYFLNVFVAHRSVKIASQRDYYAANNKRVEKLALLIAKCSTTAALWKLQRWIRRNK